MSHYDWQWILVYSGFGEAPVSSKELTLFVHQRPMNPREEAPGD